MKAAMQGAVFTSLGVKNLQKKKSLRWAGTEHIYEGGYNLRNTSLVVSVALAHYLQGCTAYKIQNGRGGPERGLYLGFWMLRSTFEKLVFLFGHYYPGWWVVSTQL